MTVEPGGLRFQPPAWVEGGISGGDAAFLLELVARVQPVRVLEIGVAAGTSSAALLYALDQLPGGRELISADIRGACYFDPARPTGAAVAAMYPQHRAQWQLDVHTDGRRLRQSLPAASIDLILIDADHRHPWPLLDVLHLAPSAAPGAWIALHDIRLPELYPQYPHYGPLRLFRAWPGATVAGAGDAANIGAVQLPHDLRELVPMALDLLAQPWEHTPRAADVALPPVFGPVSAVLQPRLRPARESVEPWPRSGTTAPE